MFSTVSSCVNTSTSTLTDQLNKIKANIKESTKIQKANLEEIKRQNEIQKRNKEQIKKQDEILDELKQDVKDEKALYKDIDGKIKKNLKKNVEIRKNIHTDNEREHKISREIIKDRKELQVLDDALHIVNTAVAKQNNTIEENLQFLQNKNSADQQKIYYQQIQTQYLLIFNFYLFYLYVVLAVIWGVYWFFVKNGYSTYLKWFWYLHVIFYPYLAVYFEFVLYYIWGFVTSWFNGNPFYPWNNYTSYPPIV